MEKPRIFIGSSIENIELAYAAQENLEDSAEVTVWDQGIFDLSSYSLEALLDALEQFDYGLFIFSPDDIVNIRGASRKSVRDNIVFELGLFIGRLGRDRSFIFLPRHVKNLHLPTNLRGVTVAEFEPDRVDKNFRAALGPCCNKVRLKLKNSGIKPSAIRRETEYKLVPRKNFTEMLVKKLKNEKVSKIIVVSYTGEVDTTLIGRFHISGTKAIDVYKRSILSDLAEQQETNLKRLAAGVDVRIWDKRMKSILVSEHLEKDIPPKCKLQQFLYDAPPSKRVYMFDEKEAIAAYYQVVKDAFTTGGSIYKGMTDEDAIYVKSGNAIGDFMLKEIENYIAGLRRISRTWEEERKILKDRAAWRYSGKRPCVEPRAVFFDLDGVLYNSLPFYVEAWQDAFLKVGIDFPEREVYLEEGRRGAETIRSYVNKARLPQLSKEEITEILKIKREKFDQLGPAKIQDGAKELVAAVANSKLTIFVVTGSSRIDITDNLSTDFNDFIPKQNVITGKDVGRGKPYPDPYLIACDKAKVLPHEAIVVENAPLGINSANQAGTFCIAVNTGILEDDVLENAGARAVFNSCLDLARDWNKIVKLLSE